MSEELRARARRLLEEYATDFDMLAEVERLQQRSRDEDTARIRLNHARLEAEAERDALRAERDALAARLAAAEPALVLADEVSRLTTWGITVTDCREGCEHPACLILRAIAKYRKARASLAAASDSISDSGESSRLSE